MWVWSLAFLGPACYYFNDWSGCAAVAAGYAQNKKRRLKSRKEAKVYEAGI